MLYGLNGKAYYDILLGHADRKAQCGNGMSRLPWGPTFIWDVIWRIWQLVQDKSIVDHVRNLVDSCVTAPFDV
jgi:hypothetical protein